MGKKLILTFIMVLASARLAYAIPDGAGNEIFTGNVGIGTTLPQTQLAVLGNVGIGTWTAAGGALMVQGGNVGIGTVNANQALTVAGIIYSTSGGFQFPDNTVQSTAGPGSGTVNSGTNNQVAKYAATGTIVSGSNILFDDGTNSYNDTGLGYYANRKVQDGNSDTAVGYSAFSSASANPQSNTIVGANALAGLTSNAPYDEVVLGYDAGYKLQGGTNTAVGVNAMYGTGAASGTNNACAGYNCLYDISTGGTNTAFGYNAGYPNAANGTLTGSNNVWLGANAGPSGTSDISNSVGIGSYATAGASNVMVLGGMGVNALNVGIGTDMNGASGSLIVASGNVGIGTITPQAALVVTNGNLGIGTWTFDAADGAELPSRSGENGRDALGTHPGHRVLPRRRRIVARLPAVRTPARALPRESGHVRRPQFRQRPRLRCLEGARRGGAVTVLEKPHGLSVARGPGAGGVLLLQRSDGAEAGKRDGADALDARLQGRVPGVPSRADPNRGALARRIAGRGCVRARREAEAVGSVRSAAPPVGSGVEATRHEAGPRRASRRPAEGRLRPRAGLSVPLVRGGVVLSWLARVPAPSFLHRLAHCRLLRVDVPFRHREVGSGRPGRRECTGPCARPSG